jgi:hypothetical protein
LRLESRLQSSFGSPFWLPTLVVCGGSRSDDSLKSCGRGSEDLQSGQVTLPFLTSLKISTNAIDGTLSCFQSLRLPRLRYFSLSQRGEELKDLKWLPEFVTFSGTLQTLKLWGSISASDLQRTLQGTQDVLPALVLRRIGPPPSQGCRGNPGPLSRSSQEERVPATQI